MTGGGTGGREVRVVLCTTPPDEAPNLARKLVEARVCACVNVLGGVRSIYRWKGAVSDDEEALLIIKTTADRLDVLRAKIVELHSYDLPEVIALDVAGGHVPYLEWVAAESEAG